MARTKKFEEPETIGTRVQLLQSLAYLLTGLLVIKTVIYVLLNFRDYFPADFRSDFLLGRSGYFYGWYQWAFYAHVVSGPLTLIVGLVLISNWARRHYPQWHRRLGRVQVSCVLLLVCPSGLAMAWHAATGKVAAAGFATLAVVTAYCVAQGWRAAVARRFAHHQQWMLRCYVLLCSAVTLRVIGGVSEVYGLDWTYPLAAWVSWLVPLVVLEIIVTRPSWLSS